MSRVLVFGPIQTKSVYFHSPWPSTPSIYIERREHSHTREVYQKIFVCTWPWPWGIRKVWSKRRKLEAFTLHYTTLHIRIIKIRTLFSFWSTLRRLYHNWALSCIYPPDAGKYGRRLNTISRRNSH